MYLFNYLRQKIKTWYADKAYNQFSKLENFEYFINGDYIQENLRKNSVFPFFNYTDLDSNTIEIEYEDFPNVWLRVKTEPQLMNVELFTIIDEEQYSILKDNYINHELFFNLITKDYGYKKDDLKLSNWQKRKMNINVLYQFLNKSKHLKLETFQSKDIIEINFKNLKRYYDGLRFNEQKLNKFIFFKALEKEELFSLLKNYTFVLNENKNDFQYNINGVNYKIKTDPVCELFRQHCITKKHVEYLSDFNKNDTINLIMDYTEAVLEFPKHNDSYYFETLKSRIRNKNLYTYFMFLRLAVVDKIEKLPDFIIDSIDEQMIYAYDRITFGLLEICSNPDLQHSFLYINHYRQNIELNGWNLGYEFEDIKHVIYKVINSAPTRNTMNATGNLGNIILELINSSVMKFQTLSDASEVINYFHTYHNLKKYKLKRKLEEKLVNKENTIKTKVKKI